MLRENYCVKEFKNGNINVKYDKDTIKAAYLDDMLAIGEILYNIDCYFIGDDFCLGNFSMGRMIYSAYNGLVYIFNYDDLKNLKEGKTVKLYGHKPDLEELEVIQEELGD